MLATDALVDRYGKQVANTFHSRLKSTDNENVTVHLLWALQRIGELKISELQFASTHRSARIRSHTMQVIGAFSPSAFTSSQPELRRLLLAGIRDAAPTVKTIGSTRDCEPSFRLLYRTATHSFA